MKAQDDSFEVAPPHLCEGQNVIGGVLRAELRRKPPKSKLEFSMLQAEQKRRAFRNTVLGSTALASAAALFLFLHGSFASSGPEGHLLSVAREFAPQVEAETETFREPLVPAATAVKQPKGQLLDLTGTEVEPNISPRSEASPSNEEGTNAGEAKGAPDRRLPTSVDPSPTEHSSLKDCSAQAQAGKYQKASDCYGRIARGGGFSAELANLEQVRVLSRALVEPDKALRALDDYAKRFPNGALRGEAALTRLDLLASSGQEERLIVEVDKILKSNWAPERHAELLLLKAEAFARADKCDLALSAADESERAGGPSQGIARVQQQCVQ